MSDEQVDWLVQERRNSIPNTLELRLSCTNPSKCWLSKWELWVFPMKSVLILTVSVFCPHLNSCGILFSSPSHLGDTPADCTDKWGGMETISLMAYELMIQISWKFLLFEFLFWGSNQVTNFHMSWQLSCCGMLLFLTWSDNHFLTKGQHLFCKIWIMGSHTICHIGRWNFWLEIQIFSGSQQKYDACYHYTPWFSMAIL